MAQKSVRRAKAKKERAEQIQKLKGLVKPVAHARVRDGGVATAALEAAPDPGMQICPRRLGQGAFFLFRCEGHARSNLPPLDQ